MGELYCFAGAQGTGCEHARLIERLRNPAPECHFRTTRLTELVGFLRERRDIGYARIRFAGAELMVSA